MNCSQLNFVQSQHFYGIAIGKASELPPLNVDDDAWLAALKRINQLAHLSAKMQIEENANKEETC